jgi:hypothetical protein
MSKKTKTNIKTKLAIARTANNIHEWKKLVKHEDLGRLLWPLKNAPVEVVILVGLKKGKILRDDDGNPVMQINHGTKSSVSCEIGMLIRTIKKHKGDGLIDAHNHPGKKGILDWSWTDMQYLVWLDDYCSSNHLEVYENVLISKDGWLSSHVAIRQDWEKTKI